MPQNSGLLILRLILATSTLCASVGCVSMIKGRGTDVRFDSDPPGAMVTVDGQEIGRAPLTHWIHHGAHAVSMQKDGFDPATGVLQSSFSGWFLLDFFGTIGILVDLGLGTVSTLDSNQFALALVQSAQRFRAPEANATDGNSADTGNRTPQRAPQAVQPVPRAPDPSPAHAVVLAVLNLRVADKALSLEEASALTDLIRARLPRVLGANAKILSREKVFEIMQNSGKAAAQCTGECEVQTGREIGAEYIVTGNAARVGGQVLLVIEVKRTRDGATVAAEDKLATTSGKLVEQIGAVAERLATQFLASLRKQ